ncbi:hypothetical protein AB0O64_32305 [Streptomyces sp. NPDC088341]|uniref:hypothetical protein n=1 Tax=Streptomyces sp. NPDC088341 TaxID=3154870 RepID=UPI00343045F5
MQTDDFFRSRPDEHVDWPDHRPGEWVCQLWELDVELMESLRFGPLPAHPDLDVAVALTRLLHEDFVARGTRHDERMNDEEVVLAVKAHRAVLERLGLKPPQLPFRHHSGFYDYWRKNDMSGGGGWQARRECIEELLGPTRQALEDLQEAEYEERFKNGPRGTFKNLIFAAVGPKPQIVLRDAVSNEVEIVRNAENCLVYKDPLPLQGLTWRQMVTWWQTHHMPDAEEPEAADALYRRLYRSLDSLPEQTVLRTYCARYAEPDGFDLPALIPQVYLHYDPYTRKSGEHSGALHRERMDFLLLAPDRSRIVIEVDGAHHYGIKNPTGADGRTTYTASPRLYSEMVAEDRRLRLAGYEIYRFGGWELTRPDSPHIVSDFFTELLTRHKKPTP